VIFAAVCFCCHAVLARSVPFSSFPRKTVVFGFCKIIIAYRKRLLFGDSRPKRRQSPNSATIAELSPTVFGDYSPVWTGLKTFRIKFKKVQKTIKFAKIHKSSKAALISVSHSRSSSEDQSILASLPTISSVLSTRCRLQCTLTMFLTGTKAPIV